MGYNDGVACRFFLDFIRLDMQRRIMFVFAGKARAGHSSTKKQIPLALCPVNDVVPVLQ